MNTKIKKWGNSFGVRIPKNFVDDLKLENANVSVSNAGEGGGGAHSNVQAGIGCYYIMYRP